jgi:hypothetical protein
MNCLLLPRVSGFAETPCCDDAVRIALAEPLAAPPLPRDRRLTTAATIALV